jgi:Tol biopolymer transport system component
VDVGHAIVARDTATNAQGSTTAAAAPTPAVGVPVVPAAELGFDDAQGDLAQDASANHDDATLAHTVWVAGRHAGAIALDGESSSAVAPSTTALDASADAMTIEGWIRLRTRSTAQVLAERATTGHHVSLMAADAQGHVALTVDATTLTGPPIDVGRWTHVAATVGPGTMRLFVDGQQVATRTNATAVMPLGAALQLGGDAQQHEILDGLLDDVRVYTATLSSYQIRADLARGVASQGPVAAYPFDEQEGDTAHDVTGNGNDAALRNATWEDGEDDGSAISFDGIDGELTTAESDSLALTGALTAEAAVRPQLATGTQVLLAQLGRGGGAGYTLYLDGSGRINASVGSTVLVGPALLPYEWTRVAVTDDGVHAALFVDGGLVASADAVGVPRTEGVLHAGSAADRPDQHLAGALDDIRVYGHVLSDRDIERDAFQTVESDAVAPDVVIGGTLADNPVLTASGADVTARATEDGDGAWTPGVTRLSFYIDDVLIKRTDKPCSGGNCPLAAAADIDTTGPDWSTDGNHPNPFSDGPHDLRVVATDGAGESTTEYLPITIDVHQMPPANDGVFVRSYLQPNRQPATELSWNANPDRDFPNYLIRYRDNSFNAWELYPWSWEPPVTEPFLVLTRNIYWGRSYTYWVVTQINSYSVTQPEYEHAVTATIPQVGEPEAVPAPSALDVSTASGKITLTWPLTRRTDDPIQAVDGYLVFRAKAGDPPQRLTPEPVSAPRFVEDDPADGDVYSYTVRAVVGDQMSAPTAANVASVDPSSSPHAPPTLDLSGTLVDQAATVLTAGTRTLSVAAAAQEGASISSLTTRVDGVPASTASGCAPANCTAHDTVSLAHDDLLEGRHLVTVHATDSAGTGAAKTLSFVTDSGPPPAVDGLHATVTNAGIRLGWERSSAHDVSNYEVDRAAAADGPYTALTSALEGDGASYTDTTAPTAGAIYYEVRAKDDAGNLGAASAPVSATRAGAAVAAPVGLTAAPKAYDVHLSWTPISAFDFSHYRVYRSDGLGPYQQLRVGPADPVFDDSDVTPGRLYRYKVSAVSTDDEESPLSTSVSAIPAGISASDGDGAFAYLWSNNSRQVPVADWCWDDQDVPSFCGIAEAPQTVSDTSVLARTPGHEATRVCDGDCTSPSNQPFGAFAPSISPDGKRVAYVEVDDDDQAVLQIADTDGANARRLCGGAGATASCLDEWPDTSPVIRHCPSPDECFSIRGTTAGALTPTFSADGTKVLYGGNALYEVGVDGGDPTKLTSLPAGQQVVNPREAPDATRIYFDVQSTDGTTPWNVNADGTDLQRTRLPSVVALPDNAPEQYGDTDHRRRTYWGAASVAPSPDGRHIAYIASGYSLFVADVDRRNAHWVADGATAIGSWSGDGRHIAFEGSNTVQEVDVATTETTTLVDEQNDDHPVALGGQQGSLPTVSTPDLIGDGRYTRGDGTLAIRVRGASSDGIRAVGVAVGDQHARQEAPCAHACPATFAAEVSIDAAQLAEGSHVAHVVAESAAGTEASLERPLIVDRSAPSAPTDVSATTGADGQTTVTWSAGDDPDLPDGTSGSSVVSEIRTQDADGSWGPWVRAAGQSATVSGGVAVEVRSRDAAGNVSAAASTDLARRAAPNPTCAIPQPKPLPIFSIGFESCDDLDGNHGIFDVPSAERPGTKIPLVGRDKRKTDCHTDEVGSGAQLTEAEKEQREEECAYACDFTMRDAVRTDPNRDEARWCDEEVWYDVYRIFRGGTVVYVGISQDYARRQCEHSGPNGKFKRVDGFVPECLMTVPYYGVARGIEQALMDMYGFTNKAKNFNRDKPHKTAALDPWDRDLNPPPFGLFSRQAPTLANKVNSVYPKIKPMYCSFRVGGQVALDLLAVGVYRANGNTAWSANFPRRNCSDWWAARHDAQASATQ